MKMAVGYSKHDHLPSDMTRHEPPFVDPFAVSKSDQSIGLATSSFQGFRAFHGM